MSVDHLLRQFSKYVMRHEDMTADHFSPINKVHCAKVGMDTEVNADLLLVTFLFVHAQAPLMTVLEMPVNMSSINLNIGDRLFVVERVVRSQSRRVLGYIHQHILI